MDESELLLDQGSGASKREQMSSWRRVVLHLVPGALATLLFVLIAPTLQDAGFPAVFAFFLAVLVVIVLWELGFVVHSGLKTGGGWPGVPFGDSLTLRDWLLLFPGVGCCRFGWVSRVSSIGADHHLREAVVRTRDLVMVEVFDFESLPEFETARLMVRRVRSQADLDALYNLFADPEVARYTDTGPFSSSEEAREVMDWIEGIFSRREGMRWALTFNTDTDLLIGTAGFNVWHRWNCSAEI